MNASASTRADTEIAVEDFGHSRVAEGIRRLLHRQGVGMLTNDALSDLLAMLIEDEQLMQELNARNRAIYAARSTHRTR